MPQLLIHDESGETSSLRLAAETVTIGRRRGNILCLPHLSVSGYHACIREESGCLIIEDLNSTNGTIVNGENIKRQVLVHLDDIIIGSYRISYSETYSPPIRKSDSASSDISTSQFDTPIVNAKHMRSSEESAVIKVTSGQQAGSVVMLEKPVTTFGKRNGDTGAIAKKSTGYYFLPVNDYVEPMTHNGRELIPQVEVKLVSGDMIEIGGEYLEFIYPYHQG